MNKKEIWIHFFFWFVFLANRIVSVYQYYYSEFSLVVALIANISDFIPFMVLFYGNYSILIPKYLIKKRYKTYVLSLVLLLIISFVIQYLQAYYVSKILVYCEIYIDSIDKNIIYYLIEMIFYLVVSLGVKFSFDWFKNIELQKEMRNLKNEADLALLKYQLNPHFLNNTLHNINYLIRNDKEQAIERVIVLSEIMNKMMKSSDSNHVQINQEIAYIKNYLKLQKLRYESNIFEFVANIQNDFLIASNIFIPFIENAFKHGDTYSQNAKIDILIVEKDFSLIFHCENLINKRNIEKESGIGIENTKKRLEILYKNKYKLNINKSDDRYIVKFELKLNEN